MKIVKVYDKLNRNVFFSDVNTGNVHIVNYEDSSTLIINTKIFNQKIKRQAFLTYITTNGDIEITINVSQDFIYYTEINKKQQLIKKETFSIQDLKTTYLLNKIYDEENSISIENHRGQSQINFTVKNELINQFIEKIWTTRK